MSTGRGNFDRHGRPQTAQADITDIRNRMEQMVQFGTIEEVDHKKSLYRVRLSETRVSNWLTAATGNADGGKGNSNPLQKGAQVSILSPSGSAEQGFIIPGVYRDSHPRYDTSGDVYGDKYEDGTVVQFNKATKTYDIKIPSGAANIECGAAKINMTDGAVEITVGGVGIRIDAAGTHHIGGVVDHDGVNVGKDHGHVSAPPGPPGPPVGG